MKPLAEVLAEHMSATVDLGTPRRYTERGGWNISCSCGALICSHEGECTCHAAHLAAVVAEWLRSDEVVGVLQDAADDEGIALWRNNADAILAALAAHAKGETSWCLCGVVQALPDGTCGNCGRRILGDDDE